MTNYVEFEVGDETYKLRLGMSAIVQLEKKLGCNPMGIFGNGDKIPTITQMCDILHASLQKYHHGCNLDKARDIFEDYLSEHSQTDFLPVILEVYKVSGIIPKDAEEAEKN